MFEKQASNQNNSLHVKMAGKTKALVELPWLVHLTSGLEEQAAAIIYKNIVF